jgi:hypothetical protein
VPTLILENVPSDVYERLRQLATASHQPIAIEAVHQLARPLPSAADGKEGEAPPAGEPIPVRQNASAGENYRLWPDPPLDSEEIPAPFDLPFLGIGERVHAQDIAVWLPDSPLILSEPP